MRHKGFTLTEVLVAITIMSIMAGVMALNSSTVGQQSAKREAERVAAFIQGHISRENMAKRGLWFQVNENNILVWHGAKKNAQEVPQLNANQGCKYTPALKLFYNIESQTIQQRFINDGWAMIQQDSTVITDIGNNGQHCITVSGADNKSLNVIIGRNL